MAQKVSLKKNISIADISIEVPNCPGCGHEHEYTLSRPVTTRNCSYQKGTFTMEVKPGVFRLELSVKFTTGYEAPVDVTQNVIVRVQGQVVS
jgi:hypothetical protein